MKPTLAKINAKKITGNVQPFERGRVLEKRKKKQRGGEPKELKGIKNEAPKEI